LVIY